MKKLVSQASSLQKLEVCFLDDRDCSHPDRFKVFPIRRNNGRYQIFYCDEWVDCAPWVKDFSKDWATKGAATSHFGTLHKDPIKTAGRWPGSYFGEYLNESAPASFLLEAKACAVLGISHPPQQDEVKAAYRKLAKATHPDTGGNRARFEQIKDAYELLCESAH